MKTRISPCTLALVVLTLSPFALSGQSDEVLTARSAKNTVFCEVDPDPKSKALRFMSNRSDVDDVQWEYTTKENEPLLLIKDNTYNLRMRLCNPLKYRVTVDGQSFIDDDYDKTLQGLVSNFQSFSSVLSHGGLSFGSLNSGDALFSTAAFNGTSPPLSTGLAIDQPGVSRRSSIMAQRENIEGVRDFDIRRAIILVDGFAYFGNVDRLRALSTELIVTDSAKAIEANANLDLIGDASRIVKELVEVDLSTKDADTAIRQLKDLIDGLEGKNVRLGMMVATSGSPVAQ